MTTIEEIKRTASELSGIDIPKFYCRRVSGTFLKEIRMAAGLTAKNICEKFGLSSVAETERKRGGVTELWVKRYSEATGVSKEDIQTLCNLERFLEMPLGDLLGYDKEVIFEMARKKSNDYIESVKAELRKKIDKRLNEMSVAKLTDVLNYVKLRNSSGDEIRDWFSFEEEREEECQTQ